MGWQPGDDPLDYEGDVSSSYSFDYRSPYEKARIKRDQEAGVIELREDIVGASVLGGIVAGAIIGGVISGVGAAIGGGLMGTIGGPAVLLGVTEIVSAVKIAKYNRKFPEKNLRNFKLGDKNFQYEHD